MLDLGGLGGSAGSVTLLSSFGGNLGGLEPPNPPVGICYQHAINLFISNVTCHSTLLGRGGGSYVSSCIS